MMRPMFSVLLASIAIASTAFGAPDPAAYDQMVQAKTMVEFMKMPAPPALLREALLKETRPEDLAFVKSMLVFWKKNSGQNISAVFNHIILRDSTGKQILRMVPVENSPGKFEINGRLWIAPEKGSISDSLRKHLAQKSATSSIFDIVSRAYAATGSSPMLNDAVYYYTAVAKMTPGDLAAMQLKMFDASKHFSIQDNFFQQVFEACGGSRPAVNCGAEEATGRLVIGLEPMTFKVRKDGNVILTPFESKKPFLAKNDDNFHWRANVRYQECADANCQTTTGPEKNRISSFLKTKTPEEVDLAYTFRPRDGDQNSYPIAFDCPDQKECDHMFIKDREKLSEQDRVAADRHVAAANKALENSKTAQDEAIQAIRPLFACCESEKCKREVLGVGIRLNASPGKGMQTTQ
jgi:hypothetical protein